MNQAVDAAISILGCSSSRGREGSQSPKEMMKIARTESIKKGLTTPTKEEQAEIDAEKKANKKKKREEEQSTIADLLVKENLGVMGIAEDGNCLYNALIDQLAKHEHFPSLRDLRQQCAQYMRDHKERFRDFITEIDIPRKKKTLQEKDKKSDAPKNEDPDVPKIEKSDAAEIENHDSPESEEDEIWEKFLKATEQRSWGGEVEAKAISEIYKVPILIFRANGGTHSIGEEFAEPNKEPLKIVFYACAANGPHYDSTGPPNLGFI